MTKLEEYSTAQLQYELQRRNEEEEINKLLIIPTDVPEYVELEEISKKDLEHPMAMVWVNDACEGSYYLVIGPLGYNLHDTALDVVRHHYLTCSEEEGWDPYMEDVSFSDVSHYGMTVLKIIEE